MHRTGIRRAFCLSSGCFSSCVTLFAHLVREQRGIAGGEHAALADAEKRDLVMPGLVTDALHRRMDVVIDRLRGFAR